MNENWNPRNANTKLKEVPNKMAYDTLLEQHIFSGVGNIIKNKTLYRLYIYSESVIGKIPEAKFNEIIEEVRTYTFKLWQLSC